MKRNLILGAIGIALIALMFALIGNPNKRQQKEAAAQEAIISDTTVPVTLTRPVIKTMQATLALNGPIRTLGEVDLGSKHSGRIVAVSVQEGSRVRAGQVVARVDSAVLMEQVNQAQSQVTSALSAKQQAAIQAAISPQQSMAAIRQSEAALASARANLDLVKAGSRTQEVARAREQVNSTKSAMDKAKTDLDRARRLYAGDAISKADVEAAQFAYDSSLANYRSALESYDMIVEGARPQEIRQAEENVRQAEEALRLSRTNSVTDDIRRQQVLQADAQLRQAQAQLRQAQQQLRDAAIVSPVDGYVTGTPAKVGQVVSPGTPVATIVSLDGVYFEGQVPETEIGNVEIGQTATVTLDAIPNRTFAGTVVAIDPKADSQGRLFAARIAINNPGSIVKPGMFGQAALKLRSIPSAITLPTDAIRKVGEKSYVFVKNGDVAKRIEVKIGHQDGGVVQVTGVSPNADVVLRGKDLVEDGSKIREDKPATEGLEAGK
ncbi:MAG: efflux RND transporter periplasmic adaptor subunit [Fimbriimonadales bacterium]